MPNETITGPDGKVWTRSEDLKSLVCEDGRTMICNEDMTTEHVMNCAYATFTN